MLAKLAPLPVTLLLFTGCERLKSVATKAAEGGSAKPAAVRVVAESVTETDFDGFVRSPGQLVIVDFYADWCAPCRELAPRLEAVAGEFGGMVVMGKVDVDRQSSLAQRHGVRSIPDVRIFRDGREVDRFVGGIPDSEIRAKLEKHSAGLSAPEPAPAPDAATPGSSEPAIRPMEKDWRPPGIERR